MNKVILKRSNYKKDWDDIYIAQENEILILKVTRTQSLLGVLWASLNLKGGSHPNYIN